VKFSSIALAAMAAMLVASGLNSGPDALAQSPDSRSVAVDNARAELAAAQQQRGEAASSDKQAKQVQAQLAAAQQKLLAEEAWAARQAANALEKGESDARGAIKSKATQLKSAQEKLAAAEKSAKRAAAESAAAAKALESAAEDKKTEAEETLREKAAAASKAEEAVAAAQQSVERAESEKQDAERLLVETKAKHLAAQDAAAVAHAKALGGLPPITSAQWDYAKARHLLFRAGFGGTPEEIQQLVEMGPHKAVAHLVEYHNRPIANIEPESEITSWQRPLGYERQLHTEAQSFLSEADGKRNVDQHAVMVRWWVRRLLESPRPLEEKLVLFWHDHFASSYRTLGDTYLMYQQNQLFRRYADNYDALLHGIVDDPAMIRYLNNDENVASNNNENFGRELLELFSLGEENCAAHEADGYTERDVRDSNTRSLTGATYERYSAQSRFYITRHDRDAKTLLGKTGNWGPHEAVDIMLQHPATARYVAKKLWQDFAYHDVEPELVEQLASVLRTNEYQIRPLLTNLFLSEQFYSEQATGGHIKSPVELLVGTAKALSLPKVDYQNVRFLLASMGQSLFDPPSVAGWPGDADWINTNLLIARYTATAELVKKSKPDLVALLKDRQLANAEEVVDHLAERCLLVELSAAKRQELVQVLGTLPPPAQWEKQKDEVNAKLRAVLLLIVSTPEYQVS
jgi:uncharacterized protein (DUF1800 family)